MTLSDLMHRVRASRGEFSVAAHQWRRDRHGDVEFIHINNKTGGCSIEKALGLPFSHQTASMRVARLGPEEWEPSLQLHLRAQPWDRLVSQYHYRQSRGRLRRDIDFRSWIQATLLDHYEDLKGWSIMFMGQLDRISGPSDEVLVDDIYRFESFEEDFGRLCRRLGVDVTLPHKKPSSHGHFSEYYDAETADIVADVFQRDVEILGYNLDRP